MATSGSTSVRVTDWDTLRFNWWQSSQSVTNNTTTIGWELVLVATTYGYISSSASKAWSVTVNGTKYSGTATVGIANNSTKVLASRQTTIAHNDDGTKTFNYSFSQAFDIDFNGWVGTVSGSGSGTLNTIARKSTLSVSNGTLGVSQRLTITEHAASFTHKLYATAGSSGNLYIIGSSSAASSTLNADWTPPASLASQNTTGTDVSVKFTLQTYSGSTLIGTNIYTRSFTIPNTAAFRPSCRLTVEDSTGWEDTYGNPVQGLSKFKITVTPALAYGSAIASYSVTANGAKYSAATVTTDVLKASGSSAISATVTDERDRPGSASVTKAVLAYTAPNISKLTVHRCDADGTENDQGEYIKVVFSATITALNNLNTAAYTLRYKKSTDDDFTEVELSDLAGTYAFTNAEYIFAADGNSSYDVEVEAVDRHRSYVRVTSASTAFTLLNWGADGTSMGIGKVAELPGVMDVALLTRHNGGLLPPVLPPETDLNDVRTPNTYVGANLSTYNYINCPLESGTFTLEVQGAGETDQVKQRIQSCGKVASRALERYYYSGTWGNWFCVSDYAGTLLWEGAWYMQATHTAPLSEPVSAQKNGIVLIFTEYISGAVGDSAFHAFFIPKWQVAAHPDKGYTFTLATGKFGYMATKYLYIADEAIRGHADNNTTGTGTSGITYTNNRFVLRYVIGV